MTVIIGYILATGCHVWAAQCADLFSEQDLLAQHDLDLIPLDRGDISKIDSTHTLFYEFDSKGLHFAFELIPSPTSSEKVELAYFVLEYDPAQLWSGSFFRRVLGSMPMRYTKDDLKYVAQNVHYGSVGGVLEFYLRLPHDSNKAIHDGPQLSVALETGKVIGYPAGTDVAATFHGVLRGSPSAWVSMARGLSIEAQNAAVAPQGHWYLNLKDILPSHR